MENKYQIALDFLISYPRVIEEQGGVSVEKLKEAYSTLQELIDLYTNESKYESFAEIHKEHQEEIERLEESIKLKNSYISMIDRALDKACYYLDTYANRNSNQWKEYLLKESENNK